MKIRKAKPEDSEFIAGYLLLAMEDLVYKFIGERDFEKAKIFVLHFVEKEDTQFSWQNCFVAEDEGRIVAAVDVYDGAKLVELRKPLIEYAKTVLKRDFTPEDETQSGEIYIDSLGVNPNQQGKGIGSQLLQFLIKEYVENQNQTLGLIVDEDNPDAKKLYLKLGFKVAGNKTLAGKKMEHLQLKAK